jgi:glutaconate CoA-transferase subunit A
MTPAPRPFVSLDDLVAMIGSGTMLAIPKDESGPAMAATRALIRRGVRRLDLLCAPVCGLQADLLIGAGCVESVECGGIVINEVGVGPSFQRAVQRGSIRLRDSTCPAIHAGLQAGEKGQPFAAIRGVIGSDLLKIRPDWRVIDNPFADGGDPVVLVPAITPDMFLFHAAWGDRFGNVWIAGRRDLAYAAHASKRTLVTIEEVWDGNLLEDERMGPGSLSAVYTTALAHVPRGAAPLSLQRRYEADLDHLQEYAALARTEEGFATYLRRFVLTEPAAVAQ